MADTETQRSFTESEPKVESTFNGSVSDTPRTDAVALEVERLRKVERAMNPRTWTEQQSAAWHINLPDVQRAFAALLEASN